MMMNATHYPKLDSDTNSPALLNFEHVFVVFNILNLRKCKSIHTYGECYRLTIPLHLSGRVAFEM